MCIILREKNTAKYIYPNCDAFASILVSEFVLSLVTINGSQNCFTIQDANIIYLNVLFNVFITQIALVNG